MNIGQSLLNPINEFFIVGKNNMHSVLNPFVHVHVPSHWAADKTDNTNTHVLPHIASGLADTTSYYLNELWMRTTKEDV